MKKISLLLVILAIFVFTVIPTHFSAAVTLPNPLGTPEPTVVAGRAVNSILGIVGSLALLMFIYGGLTWMTSAGNEEKVKKGRGILTWAVIGLFIIFTSYALVNFVIEDLIQAV